MKNQFVPYELAVKLKELGFDEECLVRYCVVTEWEKPTGEVRLQISPDCTNNHKTLFKAPLWQQAFDFFRKKDYPSSIEPIDKDHTTWMFSINKVGEKYLIYNSTESEIYATYEEARQACLEKLIELCRMKLIQTEDYLLLIDEEAEIKEGDTVYENISGVFTPYEKKDIVENPIKIMAYYPLTKEAKELDLPLLPNTFEEVNVEELAKEFIPNNEPKSSPNKHFYTYLRRGFIQGYKAAQSKQFSLEDMKKACIMAKETVEEGGKELAKYSVLSILQSLSTQQLPKEFIPEKVTTCIYVEPQNVEMYKSKPKELQRPYTTDPDKTWEFNIIFNSEGKQELVGTYKY